GIWLKCDSGHKRRQVSWPNTIKMIGTSGSTIVQKIRFPISYGSAVSGLPWTRTVVEPKWNGLLTLSGAVRAGVKGSQKSEAISTNQATNSRVRVSRIFLSGVS